MQKVSILVPVYNVGRYISRCVHSLFSQTYSDIEYIFVDDCTPDNAILIMQDVLKEYPNRKPYVKVVKHQKTEAFLLHAIQLSKQLQVIL